MIADIYLAAEGYDVRQVKNLCMEVESHSRGLGIHEKSADALRNVSAAAEAEKWEDTNKSTMDLRSKLGAVLLENRDTNLATLMEVGFWLRALEVASGVIKADPSAENLRLCIACPARLQRLTEMLESLDDEFKKQPTVTEIHAEVGRLYRRWTNPEGTRNAEDVEASYIKVRNLLRRIFENKTTGG